MSGKRVRLIMVWTLAGVGASILLCRLLLAVDPHIRSWRVERAIRRFQTIPSQALANRLMEQLDIGMPTAEQGERMLRLLLQPRITTRTAYAIGQPIGISTELPFRLYSPYARFEFEYGIDGRPIPADQRALRAMNTLTTEARILVVNSLPGEPGIYTVNVDYDCTLTHQRYRMSLLDRIAVRSITRSRASAWDRVVARLLTRRVPIRPFQGKTYHCRFTLPVELNVREQDVAEQLESVHEDRTDRAVRPFVSAILQKDLHGAYETLSGRRGCRGSVMITIQALPVAVAWQVTLRLDDGRELPRRAGSQPQRIRLRACNPATYMVDMGCFGIEVPGQYSGTLILKPDPNYAYEDPAIKSVWNGTLEYPVSFSVYVKTRTP